MLAVVVSLAWYLRSPSFEGFVRGKLIAALEDATGGRVEMAAFHWNLSQLAFEADGLTIHGLEPHGESPYAHVDRALVRLHIISLLERQVSLEQVELWAPAIHIIVNPDGSTNAPEPKVKPDHPKTPVQQLFDLAIGRVDVHDGMLLLNQHKIALDFSVNQVVAAMTYDRLARRYDGSVQVGKMDAKYQDFRDLAARGELQFSLWHNQVEIKSLKLAVGSLVAGDVGKDCGLRKSASTSHLQQHARRRADGSGDAGLSVARRNHGLRRFGQLLRSCRLCVDWAHRTFVTSTTWTVRLSCGRPI